MELFTEEALSPFPFELIGKAHTSVTCGTRMCNIFIWSITERHQKSEGAAVLQVVLCNGSYKNFS